MKQSAGNSLEAELAEARALIAAKDAALRVIEAEDYEPIGESFTRAAAAIASAALKLDARRETSHEAH